MRRPRFLLLAVALLAACGDGHDETPDMAADTATADTAEAALVTPSFRHVWARAAQVAFPHGPHQRLECASCHSRVADHVLHADVQCQDCHPVPAEVARTVVPDETACLQCHHVDQRALPCAQCHQAPEVAGVRTVPNPMQVAAWEGDRTRILTFDHDWHADRPCDDCHEASATNAPRAECRSCHEEHHVAEATCARCHVEAAEGAHGDAVHQGCGGSACHADARVLALPPSRTLCLSCHPAQMNHEPTGDCATCHGIAAAWRRGGGP